MSAFSSASAAGTGDDRRAAPSTVPVRSGRRARVTASVLGAVVDVPLLALGSSLGTHPFLFLCAPSLLFVLLGWVVPDQRGGRGLAIAGSIMAVLAALFFLVLFGMLLYLGATLDT